MTEYNFIWDLDGTLLDSYEIIVNSLCAVYKEKLNVELNKDEVHKEVIKYSVGHFLERMEKETGVSFDLLASRYSEISGSQKLNIKAMKNAEDILKYIKGNGMHNYVFTHRGKTTEIVLKNIGLFDYFDEIITSLNSFKRKPDPEAINYLVDKYKLDKNLTFYVGDRPLDIECANRAKIKSILLLPKDGVGESTGTETFIVNDLLEIIEIINK